MATNTWAAAADGNWNLAGNWSLGHVPQAGEDVVFDGTSVKNCTMNTHIFASLGSFTVALAYTGVFTDAFYQILATDISILGASAFTCGAACGFTGNILFGAASNPTITNQWSITGNSSTIQLNGKSLGHVMVNKTAGQGVTLLDGFACTGNFSISAGNFDQGGFDIAIGGAATVQSTGTLVFDGDWSVGGSWMWGAATAATIAGMTLTLTGSCWYTSNGKASPAITHNAAGQTLTLGDALSCVSLTIAAGSINTQNKDITCAGDLIFGGTSLSLGTSTLTSTGNGATLRMTATTRDTAQATFVHTGSAATLDLAGGGATVIARLDLQAGATYTWAAGSDALIVLAVVAGDWNTQTWVSDTPGSEYTIAAPAGVSVSGLNVTDCHNVMYDIDASDGTCTNGGNNVGFLWTTSSSSSSSSSRSSSSSSSSSSSPSSSSSSATTECIEAQVTADLVTALSGLVTYGGTATIERERAELQINGRFPFVEVCGPQTEIDTQQFKVGISRLTYLIKYYINVNDEDPSGDEITYLTRNVCADIIRALWVDPQRNRLAQITKATDNGYGFDVDDSGAVIFFRFVVVEVTARIDSANPYFLA